ncbi:Dicer-like protein 2 [Cyphellophora attinorum]|uniref:Dicer-like protein 2 n=1 Tax=Cyphellophora attinorum TaxID=1664694 RepID=A0A0N1H8Q5_9EURO|nr:Dicer-like protein 2 [Phialophora attinorum]KPI43442.1 Dicer-like protein 2 [Phialophora attinorum]
MATSSAILDGEIEAMETGENNCNPSTAAPVPEALHSRQYQLEMFEKSKTENIIICMDTGSGKTQIARLRIDFELQRNPTLRCWFLAQTQVLAEQQHSFMSKQLTQHSFRLITGADNAEYWASQNVWNAALSSYNGVISTPVVLYDALSHGFVSLDSMSLLVFDEAHHCVKSNPYNKIMGLVKQHFADTNRRPDILGLTATPMIRDDLKLIEELGNNLMSVCRTPTQSIEELREHVHLPDLVWLEYEQVEGRGSVLLERLQMLLRDYTLDDDPTMTMLQQSDDPHDMQKLAKFLAREESPTKRQILKMLGPWAADRYSYACISQLYNATAQQEACLFVIDKSETQHLAQLLRPLLDVPLYPTPEEHEMTPKVKRLLAHLQSLQPESMSCVIFVERRSVAYALCDVVANVSGLDGWHPFTFVGCANPMNRTLADLADLRVQHERFVEFRRGDRNLVIGTNVLEEGIDVRACNLVICFDPPISHRAYIQRRGRARDPDARFAFMVDRKTYSTNLHQWQALEEEMKRKCAEENRRRDDLLQHEKGAEERVDFPPIRTSKATIEVDSARQHLEYFCQTMRKAGQRPPRPLFILNANALGEYGCSVVLPTSLPPTVRRTSSAQVWQTRLNATKDAAFQSYKALHYAGLLTEHLLPIHAEDRKHGGAHGTIETRDSIVNVAPQFDVWSRCRQALNAKRPLFAHQVTIAGEVNVQLLLPLKSQAIRCTIVSAEGIEIAVKVRPVPDTIPDVYATAARITKFLYASVLQRRLPGVEEDGYLLSHYIVPKIPLEQWDTWLAAAKVRSPLSQAHEPYGQEALLYVHNQTVPYIWTMQKPAHNIQAIRLSRAIDLSRKHSSLPSAPVARDLPLADCMISGLQPRYARVMSYMPTILHEVEKSVRSQQALAITRLCDLTIEPSTVCSAFVSPKVSNTNYQRLEFIGDALLKFLAAINVFCNNQSFHEGALTVMVARLVSNARLHRSALETGLAQFLTTQAFSGKGWNLTPQEPVQRQLSSKTLADMIEAILGAVYMPGDTADMSKATEALNLFLPETTWRTPDQDIARVHVADMPEVVNKDILGDVEAIIGHRFSRPVLLLEALNHSSQSLPLRTYDRLEFLGDAIIDLIVKERLYNSKQQFGESYMTQASHAIVNKETFALLTTRAAMRVDHVEVNVDLRSKTPALTQTTNFKRLHDFLARAPSADLVSQRSQFMRNYDEIIDSVTEEMKSSKAWPWAEMLHLNSPKWASDILESIIGAVFIDSQADLEACCSVLTTLGLMDLVQRAVDEPDISYTQMREEIRIAFPGKAKFTTTKTRDLAGNEWVYACTAEVEGEGTAGVTAIATNCSCEAEAEERAAFQLLQTTKQSQQPPSVSEPRIKKRKRVDSVHGAESSGDDSDFSEDDAEAIVRESSEEAAL